jgi:hypothetical protein
VLDGIPLSWINGGIGAGGVVLIVGWLIATDRLVPRRSVDRLMTLMETRLIEKQDRIADLLAANTLSANQAESLTKLAETQIHILQSIEKLAQRRQT